MSLFNKFDSLKTFLYQLNIYLMKHFTLKAIIGLFVMILSAGPLMAQRYSDLWGEDGELWTPGSPLNDFSNVAGYRGGTVPLPRRPVRVSIKDFGGKGDGIADDTQALIDAIKACPAGGAIFIPNGKYKITDWIRIENLSNITILGEDMYETQLIFPEGLEAYHPTSTTTTSGKTTSEYSWSGGFFWFENAEEVGIENLNFIFKDTPFREHFDIDGSNMMALTGKNNWLKNIRAYNADNGIFTWATYTTFKNILLDAYPGRPIQSSSIVKGQRAGHHAIDMQGGSHNLIENYEETVKYIHSLGSENNATWNVWSNCKGPNIEIDHHSWGIGYNLFTDIDMGKGLGSEGQRSINKNAEQETYWNLRSTQILPFDGSGAGIKQGIPVLEDWQKTIVVGWWLDWPEAEKNKRSTSLPWYEHIGNYDDIYPKNIYIAQLKKRLDVDNMLPELQITSPVTNSMVTATSLTIAAMPNDRDGSIAKADLYIDGAFVATELLAPYTWTVPVSASSSYQVTVIATDNEGATTTDEITFTTDAVLTENGETIVFTDYNNGSGCAVIPYVNLNKEGWNSVSTLTAEVGDEVWFGPQSRAFGGDGGNWSWTGPGGQTHSGRSWSITDIRANQFGTYTVSNTDQNGCTATKEFAIALPGVCAIAPFSQVNNGTWNETNTVEVEVGDRVEFGPQSNEFTADVESGWSWTGPNGFTANTREITRISVQPTEAGTYTVSFTDPNGCTATKEFGINVSGSVQLPGSYYLKNVATGRYLGANPGGEVVHNAASGGQDTQWNLNESTPGYYFIDNAMPDRGPLAAKPALNSAIIYLAERYNNSAYQNREWQAVPVGGNVYKLLCKDNARGYLTASGSREVINAADGDGDVAHWELISVGASQRTADTPSKVIVSKDAEPVVYPNPVGSATFTLSLDGIQASEVSVYNVMGARVYHQLMDPERTPSSLTLETPSKAGFYYITTVDLLGSPHIVKFIVE